MPSETSSDVYARITSSLEEVIGDEEDGRTVADLIADENSAAPFEEIEDSSERGDIGKTLHEEIAKLPEQEQEVINGYYFDNKTYAAIAEEIGVSRERIHQVHGKALRDLRKPRVCRRLRNDLGYSSYRLYKNQVEYIAVERAFLESLENIQKSTT